MLFFHAPLSPPPVKGVLPCCMLQLFFDENPESLHVLHVLHLLQDISKATKLVKGLVERDEGPIVALVALVAVGRHSRFPIASEVPVIYCWIDGAKWEEWSGGYWGKKCGDGHWLLLPFLMSEETLHTYPLPWEMRKEH